MSKYALIFEGPQSGDADTLRKLKGAFIGELNLSIDETVNALSNFPIALRESEDQDALQDLLVTLLAAGAKARVDESASPPDAAPSSSPLAPQSPSSTIVFELDAEHGELPVTSPSLSSPSTESKSAPTSVPVLSTAQSTLLSLEDDYVPEEPAPAAPAKSAATPAEPPPIAPSTKASLESFSLELAAVEPEPEPPSDPSILEEPDLEIHFETEANEPAVLSSSAPAGEPQPAAPPVPPPPPADSGLSLSTASLTAPASSAPAITPASPAVTQSTSPSLIPSFTPPPKADPSPAPATPAVASAVTAPSAAIGRKQGLALPKIIREFGMSVLVPLVVLTIGNIIFFSLWTPKVRIAPSQLSGVGADGAEEGADKIKPVKKEPPGTFSGYTLVGDFSIEWKIKTVNEDIVGVGLKIVPPQPPEMDPRDIVAGKKPPLKVTAIEMDELPITKVGKFAASVSGPARIALVDDGKTLRAVAAAQFSLEFKPDTKVITGEITLKTEAATDSALRWVAERGENSRPNIKLRLTF